MVIKSNRERVFSELLKKFINTKWIFLLSDIQLIK